MRKQHRGFVLITTLIFLQILTALNWYGLTLATKMLRLNRYVLEKNITMYQAQRALLSVEQNINRACVIPLVEVGELSRHPLKWWQQHSCVGNLSGFRYYYVIEIWDKNGCAILNKSNNNQIVTINYYRITLYMLAPTTKNMHVILQSVLAKQAQERLPCVDETHNVILGRQMWRQI